MALSKVKTLLLLPPSAPPPPVVRCAAGTADSRCDGGLTCRCLCSRCRRPRTSSRNCFCSRDLRLGAVDRLAIVLRENGCILSWLSEIRTESGHWLSHVTSFIGQRVSELGRKRIERHSGKSGDSNLLWRHGVSSGCQGTGLLSCCAPGSQSCADEAKRGSLESPRGAKVIFVIQQSGHSFSSPAFQILLQMAVQSADQNLSSNGN